MMKRELQLSELMDAVKASSPQIIQNLSMTDPGTLENPSGSVAKEPPVTSKGKGKALSDTGRR